MEKHFQLDKQTVENFTLSQGSRKLYKLGGGGGGTLRGTEWDDFENLESL